MITVQQEEEKKEQKVQ